MNAEILSFPPRDKGRIRKRRSPEAMGRCSISLLERGGEGVPENVADIRCRRADPRVGADRVALTLATAIFATLSADQKEQIRSAVRAYARHDDGERGDECRALSELLLGEPSC